MQIDSVKFPFQGADRKSYQEMRNTDFFEGLKEKIKTFYKMRGETLFPYIQVSTTTTYESEEMIEKFKKDFSSYTDYLNVGATNLDHIDIDEHDDGSEYWSRLRKLKEQSQKGLKKYVDCPEVYDKLTLRWDGTISACCGDFDNVMKLGNIKEKSLSEIWHSNKANNYRKILSEGGHAKLPLCKNCVQYIPLEK
jgi:radical SAM protein with 4Fe4S-binding SPASM domain